MTFDEILMLQSFNPPILVTLKTFDHLLFKKSGGEDRGKRVPAVL